MSLKSSELFAPMDRVVQLGDLGVAIPCVVSIQPFRECKLIVASCEAEVGDYSSLRFERFESNPSEV